MSDIRDSAEELGFSHGLTGENKNPFIPADEWNHDGFLYSAYEQGFSNGVSSVAAMATALAENQQLSVPAPTSPPPSSPTVGTPVWCRSTLYDNESFAGWAIVTGVDQTGTIINVLTTYDGQPLQFTTDEFWPQQPPMEQLTVTLTDDDGNEFVVGYGDYADLDDNTKFSKLFYITTAHEEITLPLANVTSLVDAIKHVARQ